MSWVFCLMRLRLVLGGRFLCIAESIPTRSSISENWLLFFLRPFRPGLGLGTGEQLKPDLTRFLPLLGKHAPILHHLGQQPNSSPDAINNHDLLPLLLAIHLDSSPSNDLFKPSHARTPHDYTFHILTSP